MPFSLQSVSPSSVGAGQATLTLHGAQFQFGTTFELRDAIGTVLDATRTLLQDSATAYATFDLTGKTLETYDLWAIQPDGTSTELPASERVVAVTQPNSVRLGLVVPSGIPVGRAGTVAAQAGHWSPALLAAAAGVLSTAASLVKAPRGVRALASALPTSHRLTGHKHVRL